MTDTLRPQHGSGTFLRRSIRADDTTLPVLAISSLRLDADIIVGDEYVRCTGFGTGPAGEPTLTGCERGVRLEDGGSAPRRWPGGTDVSQVGWTVTEVVTEYPSVVTRSMIGRDFAWDAGDGNVYRYHVVEIEGEPIVIWDDEPPSDDAAMQLSWASLITGLTNISGVALDASENSYILAPSLFRKYNNALVQQWSFSTESSSAHMATNGTHLYRVHPSVNYVRKSLCSTGAFVAEIGSAGSGNGQFSGPVGVVFDGTNFWVVDAGNTRIQKFLASDGSYVSQFGGLTAPTGIALGPTSTHLYVLNAGAGEIRKYLKADHSLVATFDLGNGTADGQISSTAEGIGVDVDGRIWIADTGNHRIQVFAADGTFLGKTGSFGSGDAQFKSPKQLAFNAAGTVAYVADSGNGRLVTLEEVVLSPFEPVIVAPANGDGIKYNGTDWVNEPVSGLHVHFFSRPSPASAATDVEWTNMLNASTELFGADTWRRLVDLTYLDRFLFSVDVSVAGAAAAVLSLEYSTNITTPSWTALTGSSLSIASATRVYTGWQDIPAEAKALVLLRVVGSGGNGTADPRFVAIFGQCR